MRTAFDNLSQWGLRTFSGSPFLIAGPCSAESREQVLATAQALEHLPVSLFRAGVWKSHALAETFDGVGNIALEWLQEAKALTGLPLAIEINSRKHLEEILQAGIDVLWLGARTTVNPFAVEELALALRGVDIPIFVKNPITPDLGVWVGAIERLRNNGIEKIGVILRGFVNRRPSKWRYEPEWELLQKFRQIFPELPYICDPSHIAGDANMVFSVCQEAMNRNFHGLMIETHYDPSKALSDVAQQLNPQQLEELLGNLILSNPVFQVKDEHNRLRQLKQKIDQLDMRLVEILAGREALARQIVQIRKKQTGKPGEADDRAQLHAKVIEYAKQYQISETYLLELFEIITSGTKATGH
ncbi:MAG: bifunctional 3-deoxy-7-phosphoheptulonate synthase/chorismate mutase type II [Oligosphaeraceae bacterium]|nr:bifunctional 3-deoxy-7-phosphoheptulonate synthase/chorismate mutase type II [Oligosphaeraceae bacterium]